MIPVLSVLPTKDAANPVWPKASLASWYSNQLYDPSGFINPLNAAQIQLFLSGSTSASPSSQSIGLFTAAKSAPRTLSLVGQVLTGSGAGGSFDQAAVRNGKVVFASGTYWLFYTGVDNSDNGSIGLAASPTGLPGTFVRQGQILSATGQGRDDGTMVSEPSPLLLPNNTWALWYSYRGASILPGYRIATCATADPTSAAWVKTGPTDALSNAGGQHEYKQLFRWGSTYYLAYECGFKPNGYADFQYQCYLASGSDPTAAFTNLFGGAPWIPVGGSGWDQYQTATPGLLLGTDGQPQAVNNEFLGWYCGANDINPVTTTPYWNNQFPLGMFSLASLPSPALLGPACGGQPMNQAFRQLRVM